MTKLTKVERWIFLLTLVFFLCTIGYFILQNQRKDLTYVMAERAPESIVLPSSPSENSVPGILEGERINLNTAPKEDLMRLPGIGEARATDIITYRTTKGLFTRPEEIMKISGIGEKTYEKLAPYVCISDE